LRYYKGGLAEGEPTNFVRRDWYRGGLRLRL